MASGPTSHSFISQRLKLHYADWGNEGAPPLLLVHGGRDHCRSWDWVAEQLAGRYHVIAPDLRGHGDSAWAPDGNYEMGAFVYDLAQLIHQLGLAPVTIVAHSMGGNISLRYTGLYPGNVNKLVAIEGLGPSPKVLAERAQTPFAERFRKWIDDKREAAGRQPRRYVTLDDALARMAAENSYLTPEQARHRRSTGSTATRTAAGAGSSTITSTCGRPSICRKKISSRSGAPSPARRCFSMAPTAGPRTPKATAGSSISTPRR